MQGHARRADATELEQGCCSYGAHFVDDDDVQTSSSAFVRLTPDADAVPRQGQARRLPATRRARRRRHEPTVTRLVDDACIFLNRPGFAGGAGCALHIGALEPASGRSTGSPNVCWQLPLRLEHHTDDNGHVTSTLREWKRRDWGEGGDEFHWWCTESPEAFVGDRAGVPVTSRDEIVELVGAARSTTCWSSSSSGPDWVPLPTPLRCRSLAPSDRSR